MGWVGWVGKGHVVDTDWAPFPQLPLVSHAEALTEPLSLSPNSLSLVYGTVAPTDQAR